MCHCRRSVPRVSCSARASRVTRAAHPARVLCRTTVCVATSGSCSRTESASATVRLSKSTHNVYRAQEVLTVGLITLIVVRTLCDDVFAPLPRFYSDSMSDFARDLVRLQSCGALLVASSLPFHSFLFESPALKGQQLCRGIPYYLKESFMINATMHSCGFDAAKCDYCNALVSCCSEFADDRGECSLCHDSCLTCTGRERTDCTSCKAPMLLLDLQCLISCPVGFYEDLHECKPCHSSCADCFGKAIPS